MNTLFLVAMIVEAIFGIGFLAVPGIMMGPLGVTLDVNATIFARLFGSTLISFSILLWLARKSSEAESTKPVVYSLFAYFLISSVILVMAQLAGVMNAMGWGVVGIHLVLLVWFGYFLVR
jgi:hypothetical protein